MSYSYSLRWLFAVSGVVCILLALLSFELEYSAKMERLTTDLSDSGITVNASAATPSVYGRCLFYRIEGVIARGDIQYQCILAHRPACDGIGIYDARVPAKDLVDLAHSTGCTIISLRRCEIESPIEGTIQPDYKVVEVRYNSLDSKSLDVLRRYFPNAHVFEN